MILVVSDVHLGYKNIIGSDICNRQAFLDFLDSCQDVKIDQLVLLGDIFDLWRRSNIKVINENEEVIKKLKSLSDNVHYVVGNHDYYILDLYQRWGNYPFEVTKNLRLEDGGKKFHFMHGYQLEYLLKEPQSIELYEGISEKLCMMDSITGEFASDIWKIWEFKDKIKESIENMLKPPEKRNMKEVRLLAETCGTFTRHILFGLQNDERLIFGHTHDPFCSDDGTVANTGSWVNEVPKDKQNSYIEITDGEMKLNFFK